ncbi:hypothetical protein PGT21_024818 [Puccinia graminis f. sp. tritici]|uniref:SGNH hydrolase-type esterase domain-containing protein n=1 Tax=Puccinia graminis f. sp. tritici TaxID=56615 RepID=A0A5B0N9D0_PUCGR|nr:hypothetical protein PGT21_024818 [Puccinia graminis f. sp. tritici]KAA1113779.1 hypothetical protein PGTUg99_019263 [Puccinia graminis f. sp. tritici]
MWISKHRTCNRFIRFVVSPLLVITKASCLVDSPSDPSELQESFQPSWTNYSAFIVFGDSYSDNGHPRSPEDQPSLAAKPAVGGRFCDGPVWDEYLAQNLSNSADSNITFLNYAYNGAHIRNKLSNPSPSPVPDTAAQIQTYLTDLAKYVQHPISGKVFEGRILHALWIGINPILAIWRSASSGNQTLNADTLLTPELAETLNTQVEEFSKQLLQLSDNPSLSKFQTDYMVMTIPPLTNTALALSQSSQASKGDVTLAQQYIELLAQMTDHFNTKLVEAVQKMTRQFSWHKRRITVFDTVDFWDDVRSAPQRFGIQSLGSCYTDPNKPPCKKPDLYMYWDILHPSSIFHANLSNAIMQFLDELNE